MLLISALSCPEPKKPPYQIPQNAKFLITGDSLKTWKLARRFNNQYRMNMGDCFLSHQQTYKSDMTMYDNSGDHKDCGDTMHAQWEITTDKEGHSYLKWISDQLPDLMNIKVDYKYFKILHISDEELSIQFKHKQYSNKTTTITDFFIPEHISVEDRDFHW